MNATKILWGQVLLVCATVLVFVWKAPGEVLVDNREEADLKLEIATP